MTFFWKAIAIAPLMIVMLFTQSVRAEWERLQENSESISSFDPQTIRKTAGGRQVWFRQQYKKEQLTSGVPTHRSATLLVEFDCAEYRWRTRTIRLYTGLTQDSPLSDTNNTLRDWDFLEPGNHMYDLLKIVCRARIQ